MEININFSVPSSTSVEDIATILAKITVNMVCEAVDGYFGPGDFEVYSDGECVATYKVLQESDGEDHYPYNCIDYSDDAEALASAGFGTDEDYGYYGEDY